ncbi:MAG TPA: polyprenol monophosphomannose synthase [Spirochaetota bacterium]|nr:polyprenol monophosphomannose synthase [Spirochaetota bacterium]HOM38289.1 polyprenol monophosphomannose synthase [Spirochaetota bacterium]HPQ48493.1 polyprenol monophosphomannose synthase [Spirochaetota bacterium]
MKTLIIIPTYNESENIRPLIEEIKSIIDIDILIIDDNSPDGTASIVKEIQKKYSNIFLIQRKGKLGLASAYIEGFKYAIDKEYDFVFEMDADFSHNPKYIPLFIENIKDSDLVIGSRYIKGGGVLNWSKKRLFISKGGNIYAKTILGLPIKDVTGGFKCFRVSTLKKINLELIKSEGYSFQIEINYIFYKNGFRIKEVPIIFEERREGASKMSKKIFFEAMIQVWHFRFMNCKKFLKSDIL